VKAFKEGKEERFNDDFLADEYVKSLCQRAFTAGCGLQREKDAMLIEDSASHSMSDITRLQNLADFIREQK